MGRTVIHIHEVDGLVSCYAESACAPLPVTPEIKRPRRLKVLDDQTAFDWRDRPERPPKFVRYAGATLYQELSAQPGVLFGLQSALANMCPIYFNLDNADRAHAVPWETLASDGNGFLALNTSWPIGRIVGGEQLSPSESAFEPPLRILIVIAAAGSEGTPEWEAWLEAITTAKPAIPLDLRVLVAEDDAHTAVLKSAGTLKQDPAFANVTISCEFVPDAKGLKRIIGEMSPHILHFFCHGDAEDGPNLRIATRNDWDDPQAGYTLDADDLVQALPEVDSNLWLVVLNCCEGAASTPGAWSLATALVNKRFPAAVAMREPVNPLDANAFTRTFYAAAFDLLKAALGAGARPVPVEWSKALPPARTELCRRHDAHKPPRTTAEAWRQWTLPVLYVRPAELLVRGPSPNPALTAEQKEELTSKLATLRDVRARLAPGPEVEPARAEFDQLIEAVRQELYPGTPPP